MYFSGCSDGNLRGGPGKAPLSLTNHANKIVRTAELVDLKDHSGPCREIWWVEGDEGSVETMQTIRASLEGAGVLTRAKLQRSPASSQKNPRKRMTYVCKGDTASDNAARPIFMRAKREVTQQVLHMANRKDIASGNAYLLECSVDAASAIQEHISQTHPVFTLAISGRGTLITGISQAALRVLVAMINHMAGDDGNLKVWGLTAWSGGHVTYKELWLQPKHAAWVLPATGHKLVALRVRGEPSEWDHVVQQNMLNGLRTKAGLTDLGSFTCTLNERDQIETSCQGALRDAIQNRFRGGVDVVDRRGVVCKLSFDDEEHEEVPPITIVDNTVAELCNLSPSINERRTAAQNDPDL